MLHIFYNENKVKKYLLKFSYLYKSKQLISYLLLLVEQLAFNTNSHFLQFRHQLFQKKIVKLTEGNEESNRDSSRSDISFSLRSSMYGKAPSILTSFFTAASEQLIE